MKISGLAECYEVTAWLSFRLLCPCGDLPSPSEVSGEFLLFVHSQDSVLLVLHDYNLPAMDNTV